MRSVSRWTTLYAMTLLAAVPGVLAQAPWVRINQRAGGEELWGVCEGIAGLVAVGKSGTILHSEDGHAWVRRNANTTDALFGVTYGAIGYIAVGDHGTILTSVDATTWTRVATPTTSRLNNVRFLAFPGQFVAVGENGTIIYSADGRLWTGSTVPTTRWLRGLDHVGAHWIAVGQAGTVLLSSDASVWEQIPVATTVDLEAIKITGSSTTRTGTALGLEGYALAVGQEGVLCGINYTNHVGAWHVTATTEQGPTSRRCRALATGWSATRGRDYLGSDIAASTVIRIDESGRVMGSGADAELGESIMDCAFYARLNAFVAVGAQESIFLLEDVIGGRLSNLSARGYVDGNETDLTAGFVVLGNRPKAVLVRAAGPALAQVGVRDAVTLPVLTVYDANSSEIALNAGWSDANASLIKSASARVGAFTFSDGSRDAALLLTLNPGSYTCRVTSAFGRGIALLEVYDVDPFAQGMARAVNFSARMFVADGEKVAITGVAVDSGSYRTLLIRAVGPGLRQFGVANTLDDPKISLRDAYSFRASNDNWVENTSLSLADWKWTMSAGLAIPGVQNVAGAFPLAAGSRDAAMIVTLGGGTYTIEVSGAGHSSGVALVEVYDVTRP